MANAYKLVISEKPSVGKSIAAVLGANERKDGYFMGSGYIVSWCFGHLAELAEAAAYDEKYAKWRYDDLPILPESWQYSVARDKAKQLALLNTLMHRADVSEVINACDAGREGESIFRTVYMLNKCDKPMKRLWISSMEDTAIRKGFETLKDGSAYDDLYASALCRSKADWLVGINATRLFSVLYHRTLNVGRVVSPTLALIVQREAEIDAFKPEPFYTVTLGLPEFEAGSERMKSKADAETLSQSCANQTAVVTKLECKDKSEKPPALYDLTALQRDANRILGFTAQQTLDYLQSLYEKKLCTYPRTDSRYLTSDMADGLPALVNNVAAAMPKVGGVPIHVNAAQVINDKKVSDHHNDDTARLHYMNSEYLEKKGLSAQKENYAAVYAGNLDRRGDTQDKLNELYETFNIRRPEDFRGHSLSVSDIVALKQNGVVSCHYVDSWGFKELPGFLQPENYLKNAEMAMEDDYGMIDGIINNGPRKTVAELEEQSKTGKPISLLELAQAVQREDAEKRRTQQPTSKEAPDKKPSILAKLKASSVADTKSVKSAPKRSAEREL